MSVPFPLGQPFAFCPHILPQRRPWLQHRSIPQTPLVFTHFPVFLSDFSTY